MSLFAKRVQKIIFFMLLCYAVTLSAPGYAVLCLDVEGHKMLEKVNDDCGAASEASNCCLQADVCRDYPVTEISEEAHHHHHSCNTTLITNSIPVFITKVNCSPERILIHIATLSGNRLQSHHSGEIMFTFNDRQVCNGQLRSTILLI